MAAINEGNAWLVKLRDAMEKGKVDPVLITEAREWYANNVLYIHDAVPKASPFIGLLNALEADSTDWELYQKVIEMFRERARRVFGWPEQ
jgi:hypothetical protein